MIETSEGKDPERITRCPGPTPRGPNVLNTARGANQDESFPSGSTRKAALACLAHNQELLVHTPLLSIKALPPPPSFTTHMHTHTHTCTQTHCKCTYTYPLTVHMYTHSPAHACTHTHACTCMHLLIPEAQTSRGPLSPLSSYSGPCSLRPQQETVP